MKLIEELGVSGKIYNNNILYEKIIAIKTLVS